MFNQFLAYSASAGSGKTYALSVRYISLLLLGESPSSILTATFTKKAANEMSQRILNFLKNMHKEESLLENISLTSGLSKKEILDKQDIVLNRFLKEKNYIITLDSFFNMILRSFSLQIGFDPNFDIKDSVHDDLSINFIHYLEKNSKIDDLVNLSLALEKRKAEDISLLFHKLFELDAILPNNKYNIEDINFYKDNIFKIKNEFIKKLIELKANKREINQFLENDIKKLFQKKIFSYNSLAEHSWFKRVYERDSSIDKEFLELKEAIKKYLEAIENTTLYYIFELYENYKKVRLDECKIKNELSFNDILYYTYRLIIYEISKDLIYFKLDSKFKHILLDEFQDTSALQYLILKPLIDEIFSGFGVNDFRSFFYVGDTKQSLYRFRGAVEGLFDYVANTYNIKIENLNTNYRSAKNIVNFVNKVFLNNKIIKYFPQEAKSDIDGFVKVTKKESILEEAKRIVQDYLKLGININDIAILVFTNKDGVEVQEYLKDYNINSILKTSSSLKYNPKIAALVNIIRYLLTKEAIYKKAFLEKINQKDIDLSFIENEINPLNILDKLIYKFKYFDRDENILKLLDFARKFLTIEEFLDEFDKSNIPLAKKSINGLNIMTIHSSKGLEFKYIIIVDRLGNSLNNKNFLIFKNANPIKIDKIYTRYSKKEYFIKSYKDTLEKENILEMKDKLNLLYVALTRAKFALNIIMKNKKSEFDILNLEEIEIGKIHLTNDKKSKTNYKKLINEISSYGLQTLEDNLEEEQEYEYDIKDFNKIYFGEALHYALENINFNNPNLDNLYHILLNKYGEVLEDIEIKEILKRVKIVLNNKYFQELIKNAKIFKEQTLTFNKHLYQLDLLIDKDEEIIVIDYKSSKKLKSNHIAQVKNYKLALKNITNKVVKAYLLYILNERVEFLEV